MDRHGVNWVRLDFRCPCCGKDTVLVVSDDAKSVRCRGCGDWLSLKELRSLRRDLFAPPLNSGYVGAVMTSEPREGFVVDHGWFW